jgi:arsenate reductase-like glutaredoxin family protein
MPSNFYINNFSISKPEESDNRKNEDSLKVYEDENSIVAVISDGAGGTGLLSADWSQTLVDNFIKDKPTKNRLDNWLGKTSEDFMNRENEIKDSFKRKKFKLEGSSATLSGIELDKSSRKVRTITYGDTPIFHFSKDWTLKNTNPKNLTLSSFRKFPYLLNWKYIIDLEHVDEQEWNLELGDNLIIASDGLAIFLFAIFLLQDATQQSKENIDEVLKTRDKISDSIETILQETNMNLESIIEYLIKNEKFILDFYNKRYLIADDYSFIYISQGNF